MIWIIGASVVLYLTFIRMLVALSNIVTRPFPGNKAVTSGPRVSVLIPARNEEANIGRLLDSLLKQDYEPLEIIVYNDQSTDKTGEILAGYVSSSDSIRVVEGTGLPDGWLGKNQVSHHSVRVVEGTGLPDGWLGKNHACHRLAEEAGGDYLLFIDADVVAAPGLVGSTIARMEEQRLSLLSIFPYQIMGSRGERVVVPVMNWILLSLLPLALVRYCRWSSFSGANGQFMLFRGSVYRRFWFHREVKGRITEDIVIARLMKRKRLRIQTLVSRGEVSCRMYTGYEDAVNGFAKNVITMFGDSYIFILFFVLVSALGWIPVVAGLGFYGLAGYVVMVLIINMSVAAAGGENIFGSLLLFPEKLLAFFRIVVRAFRVRRKNQYIWKGRSITAIK